MASPIRPQAADTVYHITSRGNNRRPIYVDGVDWECFLSRLHRVVVDCGWFVHAYVLMTNHFHLVLTTPEPNVALGMQKLNSAYALHFNRRHGRRGHLFERRYFSLPIETESHLLEACRYVVLNPHRAGIPGADYWPWSSYRATGGLGKAPPFLRLDWLLDQFAPVSTDAFALYRCFIAEGSTASSIEGLLAA
jgi:REP element-mobilizing transposase RayT